MVINSSPSRPVIETRDLTKSFGALTAVDSLDLRVEHGEVFGFLGPNGAGKSTTIALLLDLLRPSRGEARLFGLDVRDHASALHRRIGLVPAEVSMPKDMTAEHYLDFRDALRGIDTTAARRDLADRLDADVGRRLGEMSTGNRQKIAIVQALAHGPDLVILDEPSRGLDPLVQHEFHEILSERVADGCTVFLSSHSLAEVDRAADRVGIIREGRLVAVEPLSTIKARATRTIEVELSSPVDLRVFQEIAGVEDVSVSGMRVSARVRGSADEFLRAALIESEVLSVRSVEADLEDVFLEYYRPEATA